VQLKQQQLRLQRLPFSAIGTLRGSSAHASSLWKQEMQVQNGELLMRHWSSHEEGEKTTTPVRVLLLQNVNTSPIIPRFDTVATKIVTGSCTNCKRCGRRQQAETSSSVVARQRQQRHEAFRGVALKRVRKVPASSTGESASAIRSAEEKEDGRENGISGAWLAREARAPS
jgi:hypothetical protein